MAAKTEEAKNSTPAIPSHATLKDLSRIPPLERPARNIGVSIHTARMT